MPQSKETIERLKASGHYKRAGRMGGKTNLRKNGHSYLAEIGRKGGETLRDKYGREHFSRIGSITKAMKEAGDA